MHKLICISTFQYYCRNFFAWYVLCVLLIIWAWEWSSTRKYQETYLTLLLFQSHVRCIRILLIIKKSTSVIVCVDLCFGSYRRISLLLLIIYICNFMNHLKEIPEDIILLYSDHFLSDEFKVDIYVVLKEKKHKFLFPI